MSSISPATLSSRESYHWISPCASKLQRCLARSLGWIGVRSPLDQPQQPHCAKASLGLAKEGAEKGKASSQSWMRSCCMCQLQLNILANHCLTAAAPSFLFLLNCLPLLFIFTSFSPFLGHFNKLPVFFLPLTAWSPFTWEEAGSQGFQDVGAPSSSGREAFPRQPPPVQFLEP